MISLRKRQGAGAAFVATLASAAAIAAVLAPSAGASPPAGEPGGCLVVPNTPGGTDQVGVPGFDNRLAVFTKLCPH